MALFIQLSGVDEAMNVRRALPRDHDVLLAVWLRSVWATHAFQSEEDIQSFLPLVRDYLTSPESELWILCSDSEGIMGFMGMSGNKMEALFIAPEFYRRGGGRRLVRHAHELRGELSVDVNEQNPTACQFYEACGFVVEARSELDSTERPFPLLHLRLRTPKEPLPQTRRA
jgi:putative acetyltransferase